MVEKMTAWIGTELIGPDRYFAPTGFESSLVLYHTELPDSFVLAVIEGSTRPAPFRVPKGQSSYRELVRAVHRLSDEAPACWFYITDPDNCFSILEWVRPCGDGDSPGWWLECFERNPAAQGGISWLGLAGADRRWLLLHEYNQGNSFEISIYGPSDFCRAVAVHMGVTTEQQSSRDA